MAPRPARKPQPELTREQLELGFRQVRRHGWPPTLDAAMQDHTHAQLIRCMARNLSRQRPTAPANAPRRLEGAPPVPPTPSSPPAPASQRRGLALPRLRFDPRRAAANDRDDD